ncbi:hypothetical protein BGX29_011357, partial [Mortierella sp. GBA35]
MANNYQPYNDYVTTPRFPRKRKDANDEPHSGNNNPIDNDDTLDIETKVLTLHSNQFTNSDIAD